MKRHSSIVFLYVTLLVALAVQTANANPIVCNSNKLECYHTSVLVCLKGKEKIPENCEELKDTRGPYTTKYFCEERAYEIASSLPKYKPDYEAKGYMCDLNI